MPARTDRRRADAYANESRIVAAAREIFAAEGAAATLTQVAARAGVGNATLYRHFPNRQTLAAAVFEDVFATDVEPVILALVDSDAPREAFIDVIERMAELMYAQRSLLPSLDHLTELTSRLFGKKRELLDALVTRGQAVGDLRADLTVDDVPTFVAMVTAASVALEQPPELRRRYLSLMLDALNPADAQPLPPLPDSSV
ncbi:TetR/AcrR family transcriptional regulator [Mycobacterium sp. 21AC1]|uniref:TetR/AcrR family transcriptional regulator n=1 Tax=[Mycobacterium] appelbergii TaxID=2939269 RepID=UPI00293927FE|nr:helix-turn-helix domain-containing protein [Mycobacterium sp. 21AC1]MDV3126558.1 TetR/AcrR family transcriptional regulator [Mycobacterium sp. 21AC1]